jgi:dolichyl-phosphate beta-glucosyltransferase
VSKSCLIIPCFNEASRLPAGDFLRFAGERPDLTLLFIDDGSTDGTFEVLERMKEAASGAIEVHRLARNAGKAEAVRAGLRLALARGAEVVGYADADLATPTHELGRMLRRMEEGPCLVLLGSRVRLLGYRMERRAVRHYLGRVFATLASIALRLPVYDTQCGAKVFRRSPALEAALERPFRSRWIFDVELLDRLLRGGTGVAPLAPDDFEEVPLRLWRDVQGSKLRTGTMIRAGLEILALIARRRPAGSPPSRN